MTQRDPVVEFDHHSSAFNADPIGVARQLQATCPVAWTDAYGGYWVVTGGEYVARVQRESSIFSSARSEYGGVGTETIIPKSPTPMLNLPIEIDPPEHTPLRRILNVIVSPKAAQDLRPTARRWVTYFIDQFIERGSTELVYELASPVPAAVTLEWLGWPTDDWQRVAHIAHDLMGCPPGSERFLAAVADTRWLHEKINELISERRAQPRGDVISYLLTQEVDGVQVSDELAVSLIRVLLFGGVDTTTALTAQALLHLHRRRDHRRELIEHPDLWESATEEFLRVYPPVTTSARTVRHETELGGCPLHVGDRVLFSRWAANLDPQLFPDPDEVILDRFPNRHQSFGLGPHRCAGSHFARIIFQETMRQVLERIPDYSIDERQIVPYPDQGAFTGWSLLPATFSPQARWTS